MFNVIVNEHHKVFISLVDAGREEEFSESAQNSCMQSFTFKGGIHENLFESENKRIIFNGAF